METDLHATVREKLSALPVSVLSPLARAFGEDVFRQGLRVHRSGDDGVVERVPIPPLLTPIAPEREAAPAAKALLGGVIAVARGLLSGHYPTPEGLFAGFTGLESECVRSGWKEAERVANARVDFLQDTSGRLLALEVNATIPAMQAYSDIVAQAFVRHVGPALGAKPPAVARALGLLHGNVDDLRRSLLAQASETGSGKAGRWALLARANDPQEGELAWIAERWRESGLEPVRITPESYAGPYDLVYRHLFARRVPAGSPLEAVFRSPRASHLWNPVNAHLEVKGMLALLSQAAAEPALARTLELGEEELSAASRFLPWTRLLRPGPSSGPDGKDLPDLPAFVASHPRELVLKRSWDYGGKSVLLAEDFEGPEQEGRMQALAGRRIDSWEELTRFALVDPSGPWIAQARVAPPKRRELVVTGGKGEWVEMVTDLSAFTGHGAAFTSSGLTSRASRSLVVNIVGGGGMAPVVPPEALAQLLG